MCGIAGIIGGSASLVIDEGALADAAARLHHRGPDGARTWFEPGAGLAHTRLAIIDRRRGEQPMFSADGRLVVVFNGEIYNHHQLRAELEARGYALKTRCDTEVLLYLFDWLGPGMVERLRGMFAFVILDRERRVALLGRDRFGKKPLYYAEIGGALYFASTLDALRALLPATPDMDFGAIAQYLVLQYVPSPLSPYRGVRKLAPGCTGVWSGGSLSVHHYWEPPRRVAPERPGLDRLELSSRLREAIAEAVTIRLESEVPLGVFLSGGLDSSTVTAEIARSGAVPSTYSVGFRHGSFDETRYARAVADRFGTNHLELIADEDVPGLFHDLMAHYDEPFADSSALATLAVAKAASQHVTVVLTGDGGDEMFGGYQRYVLFRRARKLNSTLGPLATVGGLLLEAAGRGLRNSHLSTAGRFARAPWEGYRDALFHFHPRELATLIRGDVLDSIAPSAPVERLDGLWEHSAGPASTLLWIDEQTYLPDDLLTKMDRATMAYSLEARSPMLDHVLAEFCAELPEGRLFDGERGKAILRAAYAEVLPPEILTRGKMGFGVPIGAWMRNELRPFVDELLLSEDGPLWSWLRRDVVTTMTRRFLDGEDAGRQKVWNLLALAGWARDRVS
ncbi:MAG: asparagine synthase (glutamine-hydrolyzing) [Actinomycetota bacterium]